MSAGVVESAPASSRRRPRAPKPLERRLSLLLLLAALCALVILARPLFEGSVYVFDDLLGLMLPVRQFYSQALKSGDNVLWAPQIFCGYYLHGDGQTGMCHPLHWLLYRTLPLDTAFNLEFLSSYLMLFPGMYVLLRRWKLPTAPSLLGATMFTFHGFNMLHYMHMHAVAIVAHIPWLIVLDDIVLHTRNRRHLAAAQLGITLLTASQILLGYPYYVYYSTVAEGIYILWVYRSWVSWRRFGLLFFAKLIAFAVAMMQLIPTWNNLQESIRATPDLTFRMGFSMHPLNILQLWSPFAFKDRYFAEQRWTDGNTHEMGLYMGAIATVSLFWLWLRRKHLGRFRKLAISVAIFGGVMLVISLGRYGKLYYLMTDLPVLQKGRAPTRHVLLVHLSLAILSSIALWDLLKVARRGIRLPWIQLKALWVPILLSTATLLWCSWVIEGPKDAWQENIATIDQAFYGMLLIAMVSGLFMATARGFTWAPYALILAVGMEIGWHEVAHVWSTPPRRIPEIVRDVSKPPEPVKGRVHHYSNPDVGALSLAGYHITAGYLALVPARSLPSEQWPVAIPYLHLAGTTKVYQDDHQWHDFEQPYLPRARLVSHAVVSRNILRDILQNDPLYTALVDREVSLDVNSSPGLARITSDRPGAIDIETEAPARQFLVLSESYHSGWKLTIDDRPTEVVRAYGDFMGCVVGPGKNRLSFRFEPASFTQGVRATLAGIAISALVTLTIAFWPLRLNKGFTPATPGSN